MSNPPVKKFVVGNVEVAVWQNTYQKEGNEVIVSSVTVQKTYKDNEGYKHTNSLGINEIPKARSALHKAYEFLLEKQE